MKGYIIIGTYKGKTQELDFAYSMKEAYSLVSEYITSYGPNWTIDFKFCKDSYNV